MRKECHNIKERIEREKFVVNIAARLKRNGLWIGISGSSDNSINQKHGKIFLIDLVSVAEPYFEIIEVFKAPYGRISSGTIINAWYYVMRRR